LTHHAALAASIAMFAEHATQYTCYDLPRSASAIITPRRSYSRGS
jgi:hypothetical protein